jgi:hypothetical protein
MLSWSPSVFGAQAEYARVNSAPLPGSVVLPAIQAVQGSGSSSERHVHSAPQLMSLLRPAGERGSAASPVQAHSPAGPSSGGAEQPSDPSRRDQRVRCIAASLLGF